MSAQVAPFSLLFLVSVPNTSWPLLSTLPKVGSGMVREPKEAWSLQSLERGH